MSLTVLSPAQLPRDYGEYTQFVNFENASIVKQSFLRLQWLTFRYQIWYQTAQKRVIRISISIILLQNCQALIASG